MPLKIKVTSYKGTPPVDALEVIFDRAGGTIGRSTEAQENHLVLSDPEQYISRKHATITYQNGIFFLTDTSVDGTFVENKNLKIHQDKVALDEGDKLKIGDYELIVQLSSNETSGPEVLNPQTPEAVDAFTSDFNSVNPIYQDSIGKSRIQDSGDIFPFGSDVFQKSQNQKNINKQVETSPINEHMPLPDIVEDPGQLREIPNNFKFEELFNDFGETNITPTTSEYDELDAAIPNQNAPTPASITTIQHDRKQAYLELAQIFLDAAGVKDTQFIDNTDIQAFMQKIGAIFREMINGLMAILRGRSELKSQFRVQETTLKPTDNNPLKFSRTVEEVLKQIIKNDQVGFSSPVDAVREGFSDIMNHQIAMTAGIQAAVINLLEQFDPQYLEKKLDEKSVFQKKAKSWDAYQQCYSKIASDALEDFFGESFSRAYEEQVRKLLPKSDDNEVIEE